MHRIVFDPPATIVIESKSTPSGTNDAGDGLEYRVLCAITPESDTTTHFFWAVPRNFNPELPVTEMMYQGSKAVFEEDIDVLNRQQEVLSRVGTQGTWQNTHSDAGAVLCATRGAGAPGGREKLGAISRPSPCRRFSRRSS